MVERLGAFDDLNDFTDELAELDTVTVSSELDATLRHRAELAYYLLQSGQHEAAAAELLRIRAITEGERGRVPAGYLRDMRELLALAAIWGAVEDACMAATAACLFPFDAAAYGSAVEPRVRVAVALYEAKLSESPDDVVARWLLNLAHMILGDYPDGVPAQWRLAPEGFYPGAEFARFPDRAAELGVDVVGHAGGVVFDDLDSDGDFDLLVSSSRMRDSIHYFENRDGVFVDRTAASGLLGLVGGLNLLQGDYDNDGDLDVFELRGAWTSEGEPNSLLRNDGGGRFSDVTEQAGVFSIHPTQTAAWGDYDNDGWLDLVIGNEADMGARPPQIHPVELYHNNHDGTFTNVAEEAGIAINHFVKAVTWGDYDNDGRLDLFLSVFEEDNVLFHNEGPGTDGVWRFDDRTAIAGVSQPVASLPAWWFDYDNDGWLDLFVASYRVNSTEEILGLRDLIPGAETPRVYRNRGDGTFEDETRRLGMERVVYTMGSNFGDLDNDGWLDFSLGTGDPELHTIIPNLMFHNVNGKRFEDVSVAGGFSHVSKGHAVAFTDVDHDGDQDIYVVLGGAVQGDLGRNVLWENPGNDAGWITLRLEGVDANRSAIGARIRVGIDTPTGRRDIYALVGSGGSFGGSSLQQEIGLGDATAISEIEVRWPGSDLVQTFRDVAPNRIYYLREGTGALEPVDQPIVPLAVGRP